MILRSLLTRVVVLIVLTLSTRAAARESQVDAGEDDIKLRREVEELRVRQRWLERRLEAAEAKLEDPTVPHFHFGSGGFVIGTRDRKTELRIRAVLHFDGRVYVGQGNLPDTFVVRRARPIIEGTLFGVVDFRLMPNFAYGQAKLDDGYIELHPWQWLRLRAGRYRVPIGLEWIQSDCAIHLVERSLATNLVPWRDLGVLLQGDIANSTVYYALGVFNGAPDNADAPDLDPQSDKDYVGRLFVRPLQRTRLSAWTNIGFGVAGSYGSAKGTMGATALATYRSPGQIPIFSYATSATIPTDVVVASGARWRVTPQAYWYVGPIGLLAEYIVSSQRVERAGTWADIQNRAWNLTAVFVMTLEHASFDGVSPRHPIDFRHKGFGALELALRYSELRIDGTAFPTFADPAVSVRSARELAAGINWYMTDWLKVMVSFHRTDFNGGAPMDTDRPPENALLMRLQIAL
jgi:phosphate-selective porin OprO and OprP